MNDELGRGLDFLSSQEIEHEGGVYLIVASLPSNIRQYYQYLGRTARMNNKGQYSIIIHDRSAANANGENYVKTRLDELHNLEIISINHLRCYIGLAHKNPSQRHPKLEEANCT